MWSSYGVFLACALILVLIPGPDFAMVTKNTLVRGFRVAVGRRSAVAPPTWCRQRGRGRAQRNHHSSPAGLRGDQVGRRLLSGIPRSPGSSLGRGPPPRVGYCVASGGPPSARASRLVASGLFVKYHQSKSVSVLRGGLAAVPPPWRLSSLAGRLRPEPRAAVVGLARRDSARGRTPAAPTATPAAAPHSGRGDGSDASRI